MTPNHIKKGLWLWIALCVTLWIAAGQARFEQYSNALGRAATIGLWVGTALLLIALLIARRLERARAGKRLTELYRRIQSGETVAIRGNSGLLRLILTLACAGFVAYLFAEAGEQEHYPVRYALMIAGSVALGALELLNVLPLVRQPILRIS